MYIRPSEQLFLELLAAMKVADYPRDQAEQAFLNVHYRFTALRLPYMYNGNLAIKVADKAAWQSLWPTLRIVHYTLHKPFKQAEDAQVGHLFEDEWKLWWSTLRKAEAEEQLASLRTGITC